jgi:hypothetical protein
MSECNCGGESITHEVDTGMCLRERVAISPRKLSDGMWLVWSVNGKRKITEYTLYQQRGYYQHSDGKWSCWKASVNSLPDET